MSQRVHKVDRPDFRCGCIGEVVDLEGDDGEYRAYLKLSKRCFKHKDLPNLLLAKSGKIEGWETAGPLRHDSHGAMAKIRIVNIPALEQRQIAALTRKEIRDNEIR